MLLKTENAGLIGKIFYIESIKVSPHFNIEQLPVLISSAVRAITQVDDQFSWALVLFSVHHQESIKFSDIVNIFSL